MKRLSQPLLAIIAVCLANHAFAQQPTANKNLVFAEKDGVVAVEAEHFFKQTSTDVRAFYLTTADNQPTLTPDGDPNHVAGASGGAYLEILPDTRRTHADKLTTGINFSPKPGKMAILHYKVNFETEGKYYVWVRAFSTGGEDNGLHVGIDGTWPDSGQRLQWCEGKNGWRWESKQRTNANHCGEAHKIFIDIKEPGEHTIHFSMREDGFEFDKWLMTTKRDFVRPNDVGPDSAIHAGTPPKSFPFVAPKKKPANPNKDADKTPELASAQLLMTAKMFADGKNENFYGDRNGRWMALNPDEHKNGKASRTFPFPTGHYNVTLQAVGESDGKSTYEVSIDEEKIGDFECPLSKEMYEEAPKFSKTWRNVQITEGAIIAVASQIGSTDGLEFSRARWASVGFEPADDATKKAASPLLAQLAAAAKTAKPKNDGNKKSQQTSPTKPVSDKPLIEPRQPHGKGDVAITGEKKTWHNVTLTLDGPFAHEQDNEPNPFTDYRMEVSFQHSDGTQYIVPGYFAADGDARNSSAESGTQWRAHFAPDRVGEWNYRITFAEGKLAALDRAIGAKILEQFHGKSGTVTVVASDKSGRDLRGQGRLQYVGKHYLQFADSKTYFLKVGADAPETLLGYADFDNTVAGKPKKVPLKTFAPHVKDWKDGDPTWRDDKGKGLIGAINYLSEKGCNAFSFLTYNAGGDGDNVWPFIQRDDKLHYDCSKLDQWATVFEHGTGKGMYLHFKMQETENDDHNKGKGGFVPTSLDGGNLGTQRKLYCRELIARFGHNLALNWNLGEENTQTNEQQQAMIDYIANLDAYDHNIVVHTYPGQQDKVYKPLLGTNSKLTGASLQNSSLETTHAQTLKWVKASADIGKPWIVAFDESGSAAHAQCPDLGYRGFDGHDKTGKMVYTQHKVRKQTLWGNLMAGGAGCEYYFGYQFDENDLICEDWRSRDQSWDYCRIAIEFFHTNKIPFWEMKNDDARVGNSDHKPGKFCFAKSNHTYLVYLPDGVKDGETSLDLSGADGANSDYDVHWFNPRTGGELKTGSVKTVKGGEDASLGEPPADKDEDWLVVVRNKQNATAVEKTSSASENGAWQPVVSSDGSLPVKRHEATYIGVGGRIYLLGGRRIQPVSIFDPAKTTWSAGSVPPIELHHFQAVTHGKLIYVAGALTGRYPGETPAPFIYVYDTEKDIWRQGDAIPESRQRGSTANVVRDGKLYMVSGIRDGHRGDHKPWFDSYDLATGEWQQLPDTPQPRDHAQAAIVGDKLYLIGGRKSHAPKNTMGDTTAEVDIFDFTSNTWSTCDANIPTERAGLFLTTVGEDILAIGGEALGQKKARSQVEAFNTRTQTWRSLAPLLEGRHGTGAVQHNGRIYVASGCGNVGGSPELTSQESVAIPDLMASGS